MGRWGDGEMGRWGDGEMGRWGDGEIEKYFLPYLPLLPLLPHLHVVADMLMAGKELTIHGIRIWDHGQF
ncbi:hypothetical protein NSTC745_01916 [Nostoc sp. DSM 114161]|jgi:hypothetical protein